MHMGHLTLMRFTGHINTQKCVHGSCENGGVCGMIETVMASGYNSCNPAIMECTALHRASVRAACRMLTMRAMACESGVVLNPWPSVQHPNQRYSVCLHCSSAGITTSVVVKKKKRKKKDGKATLLFPRQTHSFCRRATLLEGFQSQM